MSATHTNSSNENDIKGKINNEAAGSSVEQIWLFKVKRYPWAISYGNKKLDRTIETMKYLVPQFSIPSPQNMDPDSGKSLISLVELVYTETTLTFYACHPITLENSVNLQCEVQSNS